MVQSRVVFFGTPEITLPTLEVLNSLEGFSLVAVVAQPDRPKGRNLHLEPPPSKQFAERHGIPLFQPAKARDPVFVQQLAALQPDVAVVLAYGQILPQALLDVPRCGCLNVHTSLLPRHRGAAPIQWAIALGDAITGITLMKMDAGMDTGPIVATVETPICPHETGASLHDRLAMLGAELVRANLASWVRGEISATPQPSGGVTHARKIVKEDGLVDWSRPAVEVDQRIRAFYPWPGAQTTWNESGNSRMLKLWECQPIESISDAPGRVVTSGNDGLVVACGSGALRIMQLQREGGKRLPAGAFLAGNPLPPGTMLGQGRNEQMYSQIPPGTVI